MSFSQLIRCFWGVGCLAALALAFIGQVNYDAWRLYSPPKLTNVTYNEYIEPRPLSSQTAQLASFGAREFLADWYWLQLIQYYGGGDPYGKYRKLPELFNLVTDLSPKFSAPYTMGMLILPGEGYVDQALALGEKGQRNLPTSWEVPYYRGLIYHMHKKDFVKAAQSFEQAAALPNAPANAKLFAAIYYKEADQRKTAYEIFKTLYETSENSFVKERAKKYVGHLEVYFFLEDGLKKYQERFGRYPDRLEELAQRRIIDSIPVSPLNVAFTVEPGTGRLSEQKPR